MVAWYDHRVFSVFRFDQRMEGRLDSGRKRQRRACDRWRVSRCPPTVDSALATLCTPGQGTPSISGDRKRTKPKRQKPIEYNDVAQARDYANMTKSTKPETNWTVSTLPHCIVIPSAQRGGPKLQRFSTKQTTTATVICPRFCPASKRERQGRNINENEHGSSKHTSPANFLQTIEKN